MTLHATPDVPSGNLLKFLTKDKQIRLLVVDTTAALHRSDIHAVQTAESRRLYEGIFTNCCLLRGLLTEGQRLTVNIRFAMPGHSVRCEADGMGNVHCLFSPAMKAFAGDPADLVGEGATLSITRGSWLGGMFTGMVEIADPSPARFFARFYTQSDQSETAFLTWVNEDSVRGVMVQPLPFADADNVQQLLGRLEERGAELHSTPWDELPSAMASFASLLENYAVRSDCHCSKEMFFGMLMAVDAEELTHSMKQNKSESTECGVCGAEYVFEPHELEAVLRMKLGEEGFEL